MSAHIPVTLGRIVHYVLPENSPRAGEVRPAVIVRVINQLDHPTHAGMANLRVLTDGPNDAVTEAEWVGSVVYSDLPVLGTWHWPPRA